MIVEKDRNSDSEKERKESQGWGGVEGAYFDFYQNSIRYRTVPYRYTVESPKSRREHISVKGINGPCKPIFQWIATILTEL